MRAAQKYLINKRLVTDTTMFGLGVRPLQRYRMKTDMDIPVFGETFRWAAPRRALYMQSPLDGFFKSQCFLRRDPACL